MIQLADTVRVESFGCRLNAAESEVIGRLAAGLRDTVVVNTCAVTLEAERQCRRAVARIRRERPGAEIVATGCAVQIDPQRWAALPGVSRVLGNQEKLLAESWLPGAPGGVAPIAAASAHLAVRDGERARARALLDVQQGCDHACTFCIIPRGRGASRSLPVAEAVAAVRALADSGVNEVVLTGVDLASYRSGEAGLGELVGAILAGVPELARLRLSSLDPAALDPALWRALAEQPRLMPHLHLSLQAGADLILKRMRRRHRRAGALALIARARALRPGLAIGADLIAGFPTETDELFRHTLDFVEDAQIPYLHVFPYSERPGTPAARMPALPVALRRERAGRLRQAGAAAAARFHAGFCGRTVRVIAERDGRGHTDHFAPVRLAGALPLGSLAQVRIAASSAAGLEAE